MDLLTVLGSLGYGAASAVVPVLNAEAYVVAVAATASSATAWAAVAALGVGTTVGKVAIFWSARHGGRWYRRRKETAPREPRTALGRLVARASTRMLAWLSDPRLGPVTVLIAAYVGVPPLLLVSALAGLSRVNPGLFAVAVLVGRSARFLTIAWPVVRLAS